MKKQWLLCLMLSLPAISTASDKVWSGDSELGYVKSTGNTISDTLTFKQSVVYDSAPWKNILKLEASNVSSEQKDKVTGDLEFTRTGERYYLTEQLERLITDLTYGFARATYEKQRFSGFDNKATGVVGVGHYFVKNDSVELKLELGLGEGSDKYTECHVTPCDPDTPYGDRKSSVLGYFSELVTWKINEKAEFGQDVSVEETTSNRVTRFHVYVKSELIHNFSMKIGYMGKYTDTVPADKKRVDEETSATLMYSF